MKKHNPELTFYARELRKNMTPQENKLWYEFLRKYPINFLRQKIIDNYIVDFYCSKAKLAIEIDGEYHNYKCSIEETIRTKQIEKYNIMIIRIPNNLIDSDFKECCEYIDTIVNERLQTGKDDN
ncbi:MAG: DUF559 domain-containing protein [Eubacterium sp.]|nr:DUF559 domain-containing protein [Eubacterium sp.]